MDYAGLSRKWHSIVGGNDSVKFHLVTDLWSRFIYDKYLFSARHE